MAEDQLKIEKAVIVNTESFKGSLYSQIVGISVTDADLTLEFVYVNPRDNTKGDVVSRVTIPINGALGLSNAIQETINQHIKRKVKKE